MYEIERVVGCYMADVYNRTVGRRWRCRSNPSSPQTRSNDFILHRTRIKLLPVLSVPRLKALPL